MNEFSVITPLATFARERAHVGRVSRFNRYANDSRVELSVNRVRYRPPLLVADYLRVIARYRRSNDARHTYVSLIFALPCERSRYVARARLRTNSWPRRTRREASSDAGNAHARARPRQRSRCSCHSFRLIRITRTRRGEVDAMFHRECRNSISDARDFCSTYQRTDFVTKKLTTRKRISVHRWQEKTHLCESSRSLDARRDLRPSIHRNDVLFTREYISLLLKLFESVRWYTNRIRLIFFFNIYEA